MERVPTIAKDRRHAAGCHGPILRTSDTVPCNDGGDNDVTIFIALFFPAASLSLTTHSLQIIPDL